MSEEELPEGWAEAKLADGLVTDLQPGFACGAHSRDSSGVPHLRPMNVTTEGSVALDDVKFILATEVDREERWIRRGDVLFNNTNSPELVGKTAYYGEKEPRAFSNHMTRLRPNGAVVDAEFLAMVLHQRWREGHFAEICNNHVSQASIGRSVLLDTEVPVPPLAEQRRIVEKVEALLAEVNAARARLAKVPTILKRFRQSILSAACSGRLTEDWRDQPARAVESAMGIAEKDRLSGMPEIPQSWVWVRFGSLVSSLRMGTTVPPGNEPTAFPVLRSSSVRPGVVDFDDVRYLAQNESENAENFLSDGDLLFTRLSGSIEYVANCGRVTGLKGRRIQYPDRLFRATLREPSQGAFIERCFSDPTLREFLTISSKSTAGHQRISMGALTEFPIPLPPRDEQHEIVRRVDALFKLADTIEAHLTTATARADKLTQAILAKAFRGELVPTEAELARQEGRDYEPASALLARIRGEREAQASAPKPRAPRAGSRSGGRPGPGPDKRAKSGYGKRAR